jgi:putative ABC transport system permease protein
MRPYALFYIYRNRLRVHAVQELLAGLGIAAAVALIFAVTVANGSILGSAGRLVHAITGPASLQLRARGPEGFDERLLARVEAVPGVKQAAPVLEQSARVAGAEGRHTSLQLVGSDVSLGILNGLAHTLPVAALSEDGVGLSSASADELGVSARAVKAQPAPKVTLKFRGRAYTLPVESVLGREAAGALSQTRVAFTSLAHLQRLAGLEGRVSRILVQPAPGREKSVRLALRALAGGRLTVAPADQDLTLLGQALGPSTQANLFFAAVAGLLGLLFAFNAMLLTIPERRKEIADLRLGGTTRGAIAQLVLFQALFLGLVASLVGLLIGYALSVGAFSQSPEYLSQAFVLGGGTVIGLRPVLLSVVGGVLAACLASTVPLLDLRRGRAIDAVYFDDGEPGYALKGRIQLRLGVAAGCLLALTAVMVALFPPLSLLASALLALATVLLVPVVLGGVLAGAGGLARRRQTLSALPVALTSLKATTLRSLALAATGATALFGAVALGGAREDLLDGLHDFTAALVLDADVWVLNDGNFGATSSLLPDGYAARMAALPGVASVNAFQGEFAIIGNRLVWIIARPPGARVGPLKSQLVKGRLATAVRRLREGGWVLASTQFASDRHAAIGGTLSLPTPTGNARLRLAATTTNFGWPGGAVIMNTTDYSRLWATTAPTALGVDLASGASSARVQRELLATLGSGSGLEVLSARERARRIEALTGEGLSQLGEISALLVIAAILAMAAALASAIWQRRGSLAALRLSGARPSRLRAIVLIEATLMLGAGCLAGVVVGIYGQLTIDGYLRHVTGFPVTPLAAGVRTLEILALVVAVVLSIVAVPAWSASRVSPALALEEE